MSGEKTPTLCNVVPFFQSLISSWEALQEKLVDENEECQTIEIDIIQAGINKLKEYFDRTDAVPACTIAMSKSIFNSITSRIR